MTKGTLIALALAVAAAAPAAASQEPPASGKNLGSVTGGDLKPALQIIEKKCTACHNSGRISSAIAAHRDMLQIQREMERKGARLTTNEREVLGIYWKQHPLKEKGK